MADLQSATAINKRGLQQYCVQASFRSTFVCYTAIPVRFTSSYSSDGWALEIRIEGNEVGCPRRGHKNTGRGAAKRNPCTKTTPPKFKPRRGDRMTERNTLLPLRGSVICLPYQTGASPLPVFLYRGCTPACVLSPFQGYWGYTIVGAPMFQSLLEQLIYSSNANRSSYCIPYASRNSLYSSRKVRFL